MDGTGGGAGAWRTAIVRVRLSGASYRAAHEAAHRNAGVWNLAVEWVRGQWSLGPGNDPSKYDIQKYVSALPAEVRPLHSHTVQAVAHDLYDAIKTSRANRRQGLDGKAPWRPKKYRPLSFSARYGWRVAPDGTMLNLSLGRGRPGIRVPLPVVTDPMTGQPVAHVLWGEIKLCWDRDARTWSLHISVPTVLPPVLDPAKTTAIDEGVINPFALATQHSDGSIDVVIVNGREARAIKRERSKKVAQLDRKMSKCADGSRRKRRLQRAKKRVKASTKAQLRDFNHHVSRRGAEFIQSHDTGRVVVGDVRGVERNTERERRVNRSTRQQLSQWERGVQERYLAHKTGVELEHIDESYSTKTCPACLARNRPSGRRYRCRACHFTCHRDAVGAINILMKALHGNYTRVDPNTIIRVMYLRAVPRWSPDQREAHRKAQSRTRPTRARSSAPEPGHVACGSPNLTATTPQTGSVDHPVAAA